MRQMFGKKDMNNEEEHLEVRTNSLELSSIDYTYCMSVVIEMVYEEHENGNFPISSDLVYIGLC